MKCCMCTGKEFLESDKLHEWITLLSKSGKGTKQEVLEQMKLEIENNKGGTQIGNQNQEASY